MSVVKVLFNEEPPHDALGVLVDGVPLLMPGDTSVVVEASHNDVTKVTVTLLAERFESELISEAEAPRPQFSVWGMAGDTK